MKVGHCPLELRAAETVGHCSLEHCQSGLRGSCWLMLRCSAAEASYGRQLYTQPTHVPHPHECCAGVWGSCPLGKRPKYLPS